MHVQFQEDLQISDRPWCMLINYCLVYKKNQQNILLKFVQWTKRKDNKLVARAAVKPNFIPNIRFYLICKRQIQSSMASTATSSCHFCNNSAWRRLIY